MICGKCIRRWKWIFKMYLFSLHFMCFSRRQKKKSFIREWSIQTQAVVIEFYYWTWVSQRGENPWAGRGVDQEPPFLYNNAPPCLHSTLPPRAARDPHGLHTHTLKISCVTFNDLLKCKECHWYYLNVLFKNWFSYLFIHLFTIYTNF